MLQKIEACQTADQHQPGYSRKGWCKVQSYFALGPCYFVLCYCSVNLIDLFLIKQQLRRSFWFSFPHVSNVSYINFEHLQCKKSFYGKLCEVLHNNWFIGMANNVPQWKWKYFKKKKPIPILEACMTSEKLMNLTESCVSFFCVFIVLDIILPNGI